MATPVKLRQATAPPPQREQPSGSKLGLWLLLAFLTALYVVVVTLANRRFVWFDELVTFDIARSASLHRLWESVLKFDNNPPILYLLSRFSMNIFGSTPLGLRFPSMVEFYLGSIAILFYVRRIAGNAAAGLAVVLLWSSFQFRYATEARPYALIFMCFAFLLLSWDTAVHGERRRRTLVAVALSATGLLCAHVFAGLSLFPFLAAEGVRFWRRRKTDYPLWAALLLPLAVTIQYVPLIRGYANIITPLSTAASFTRMSAYFRDALNFAGPAMFLAVMVILLLPGARKSKAEREFSLEDWTVLVCLLLNPVFLNLVLMTRQAQFYDRYCLTTYVTICAAFAILLARRLKPKSLAVWAAIGAILIATFIAHRHSRLVASQPSEAIPWVSLRPDLPLVAANGQTFYEMNHHESPEVLSRLYFLKDRAASIRYEHVNVFQDFEAPDAMKAAGFPIRAHVEAYTLFVRQHPQFLVLGSPSDWLLRLLHDEGATISLMTDGEDIGPYPRESHLYLVTMRQVKVR